MKRLLVDKVESGRAFLRENELHHLTKVLRAQEGDRFEGVDSQGSRHLCELRRESGKWYGEILTSREMAGESPFKLSLAQALIKKDRFEWVIQKAVELGVTEIIPILSERTEIRLNEEREERKMGRWYRILEAAVKQSGRSLVPHLGYPVSLADLVNQRSNSVCMVMDEEGGVDLRGQIQELGETDSCLVLVGPEGGWGARDREIFAAHSLPSVSLGPRILRTETAAVVALSLLQYEFGDLISPRGPSPERRQTDECPDT